MATADKLNRLKQTKADLKAALIEKGQNPGDVFSDYPDMVRAIETGGGEQATPVIEVSNGGLITATAGDKTAYKQLSTQGGKTITPGPTEQIAVAAGKFTTEDVKVAAVSDEPPTVPVAYATADSGRGVKVENSIDEEFFVTVVRPSGVKYYFNHAHLPEIPADLAAEYPYAVILAGVDGLFYLWVSTKPAIMATGDDGYYQLRIRGDRLRCYHSNSTLNEWAAAYGSGGSTYNYYNQLGGMALWWSNHDIYWDDELFWEAGAVLTQEPPTATEFLYNGLQLPTFPDNFLTGDYPYHALLRSRSDGDFFLYGFKEKPYYQGGTVTTSDYLHYTNGRIRSELNESTGVWGSVSTSTSDSKVDMEYDYTFAWANFNIPNGSATSTSIQFYGSQPVPID